MSETWQPRSRIHQSFLPSQSVLSTQVSSREKHLEATEGPERGTSKSLLCVCGGLCVRAGRQRRQTAHGEVSSLWLLLDTVTYLPVTNSLSRSTPLAITWQSLTRDKQSFKRSASSISFYLAQSLTRDKQPFKK